MATDTTREWRLNAEGLEDLVESIGLEHMGTTAATVDPATILSVVLDEFFYGYSLGPSLNSYYEHMRFPRDILDAFHQLLRSRVERILSSTVPVFYPGKRYSYRLVDGDLFIEEVNITPERRKSA